jgi:hypothetical protein
VSESNRPGTAEGKRALRRNVAAIFQGALGNAAWALLLAAAVATSAFLKGSVPAWLAGVVLLLGLGASSFIATAFMRQLERARGERDEARRQATKDRERVIEIESKADLEKRELREQLAAVSGGQQAVSTRMQSIARQVDALASVPPGRQFGPDPGQIRLLTSLLEDFDQKHPDDPVIRGLLTEWHDAKAGEKEASWNSALKVLKARAVSIGAEESLGQPG